MEIKTNLHFHTKDDREEDGESTTEVHYDLFQGLDEAKKLGFNALAVTCHNFVTDDESYYKYAEKLGITLIRGIEKTVGGKHVVILNVDKSAEHIKTFSDLRGYRTSHPESFFLAPHPFFDGGYSLGKKLKTYAELFDAIEYSWFHFKFLDLNAEAYFFAKEHGLPLVATSDTHDLANLGLSYAILDVRDNSFAAIVEALKTGKIRNVSPDTAFWNKRTWRIILQTMGGLLKGRKKNSYYEKKRRKMG